MKALIGLFLVSAAMWAGPISITLENGGTPVETDNLGREVGPYTIAMDGNKNVSVLCVDDSHWSYLDSTWQVNVTPVGSNNLSNTYHPSEGQEYEEDAYLLSQIVKPNADRVDIQDAAWDIMDFGITNGSQIAGHGISSNVTSEINNALQNYSAMNFAGYEILTDTKDCNQEFLVNTPEPGTSALMGGALVLGSLASARLRRRRKASKAADQVQSRNSGHQGPGRPGAAGSI